MKPEVLSIGKVISFEDLLYDALTNLAVESDKILFNQAMEILYKFIICGNLEMLMILYLQISSYTKICVLPWH